MTEIGSLARNFALVRNVYKWKQITEGEKAPLIARLLDSHVNKKWESVFAEAKSRYERMKKLSTQNLEEGVEPLTHDEIACTVLDSRPGYKKGFGHNPKPLSSSQSVQSTAEYRQQTDMIKELQVTIDSLQDSLQKEHDETKEKLENFEDAQQQMMQQLLQMQPQMQRALQGTSTNAYIPPES